MLGIKGGLRGGEENSQIFLSLFLSSFLSFFFLFYLLSGIPPSLCSFLFISVLLISHLCISFICDNIYPSMLPKGSHKNLKTLATSMSEDITTKPFLLSNSISHFVSTSRLHFQSTGMLELVILQMSMHM